ncbi:hypothetical protein KSP40_PGU008772 [Platanthera guangdongensis]|uniref:RBR-type E3 ubiquitin transferase n=1 Tax=Platanthera guangdongensis TaxID=2320717 RepID=A0ABR2MVT5_9ASPA
MEEPSPRNPVSQAGESSGTTLPAKPEMELGDSSPLPDSSCEICTEPKHTFELFAIEGCSHAYCKTCLSQYVSSKLEKNELLIKCPSPDCTAGKLHPGACSPILEHGVFDRWCAALCESMVENKFYCPFKDCSALMINDAESAMKEAECPHCNRLFCAHCMVPWHAGLSCSEFQAESSSIQISEDLLLINLAKNSLWKRCPNCKFFVEKTTGCMFVKCSGLQPGDQQSVAVGRAITGGGVARDSAVREKKKRQDPAQRPVTRGEAAM